MNTYKQLRNNVDVNRILDTVNVMYRDTLWVCHGRTHIMFVLDAVETILRGLEYDARTIELGKIAALLHDVGNIAGRWEHARKSAGLAAVFLDETDDLTPEEKRTVLQAIEEHSGGCPITSVISAAVIIADKADASQKRQLFVREHDAANLNDREIEDIHIQIRDKRIEICFDVTDKFNEDLLFDKYEKGYKMPKEAAEYLGCTCHFIINGKEKSFA
ncbi:MAG: HD domain-containing protein [Defluviitaleaceae bacterium]|nr:HD domain-containing protein [Defluviitaleaceae bacterium]MCL2274484.1 HD domain-containing protein [Defluviitaleaceae bacterium]